jgi:UDP-N-acetylmuramoyl-tripeptide--D-alanyl-D-alanine ligase
MTLPEIFAAVFCIFATGVANVRWLRVAQREHYLSGSVSRFSRRWTMVNPLNMLMRLLGVGGLLLTPVSVIGGIIVGIVAIAWPFGLSIKGRTAKLVWTRRLKTLAGIAVAFELVPVVFGFVVKQPIAGAALAAYFVPMIIDLALAAAAPYEKKSAYQFVLSAKKRLQSVNPTVVAITGSYGKTSTKQYVAHLVSAAKSTFASPASFNNRGGLSKAVNEQLSPGTEVFVAEMGAYGKGEIAELCEIFPPEIAVMTAIGPVHLERYGTEEAIVEAKSEIFVNASVCVLNVDDARIAALVEPLQAQGKKVWRVGSVTEDADVRVVAQGKRRIVTVQGRQVFDGETPEAPPTNVACAVAVAAQLGVSDASLAERLPTLPVPQHRQEVAVSPDGLIVIDDTFNANPASVRRVLELLGQQTSSERRVLVTPGMVELGKRQNDENRMFAKEATATITDMVVVGKTNRVALLAGAREGGLTPIVVDRLPDAVAWVRQHIGQGDAVAYVNDLPDHFP